MVRIGNRQAMCKSWVPGDVTPYVKDKIRKNSEEARLCKPYMSGRGKYEVVEGKTSFPTNLREMWCKCGRWHILGIPCKHALRVINNRRLNPYLYVSEYYSVEKYKQTYELSIRPMPDHTQWPQRETPHIVPSEVKRTVGRPKRNRKREPGEQPKGKRYVTLKCSKCGEMGHNMRGCKGGLTTKQETQSGLGEKKKRGFPHRMVLMSLVSTRRKEERQKRQRIPSPWQLTNSYVLRSLTKQFQGYHSYNRLSYISKQTASTSIHCPMSWDRKRKSDIHVWRPISTQSTSNEDFSVENIMAEPGNVSSIEQNDHEKCVVSAVREAADSSISSLSLQAENEVAKAEGVQVNPGSTGVSGLKNAEGVFGDQMTASALHDNFGAADAENSSIVYKDKHAVSVEVGASVMHFIRGKDKSVQKDIEEEMGVTLLFPSSKNEDYIVIEGESMDAITKASEKIQAIIDEAVKSPALSYSHFISLPLAIHSELVDKLTRFQSTILGDDEPEDADGTMDVDSKDDNSEDEEVSDKPEKAPDVAVQLKVDDTNNVKVDIKNIPLVSYACKKKTPTLSDLGIDKSIFIKPKTFHLTVLMLKLWNKGLVHAAKEVLQSVYSELMEVLDNRPLFVRLKGLDCLRGSRSKAQVLYAPIEEIGNEGRLLRACQIIIDAYVKAGLVLEKDARQKLKLHATVMNTTHRKGRNSKRRRKDTFDAQGIFEQFGSEQWGDYHIREAHLSQRFLYDENGYYHCCGSIPFPENSEVPESSATQLESEEMSVAESV